VTLRGHVTPPGRDRRRHRPSRREGRRRLPTEVLSASQAEHFHSASRLTSDRRLAPDVARPGTTRGGGRFRAFVLRSPRLLGAGRGSPCGCLAPWSAARRGPGRVWSGGDPGRDLSSASLASLTIRSSVTQASRDESLRGSGNINLSQNARGDVGPSCRGRGRVAPQSRNGRPATSHDAAGRGTDGRFDSASSRSIR